MKSIQVNLSTEIADYLETSEETTTHIFKNAIRLYKFIKEEEALGSKLMVEDIWGSRRQVFIP